eukprot:7008996-Prymnesium_polylepis.1
MDEVAWGFSNYALLAYTPPPSSSAMQSEIVMLVKSAVAPSTTLMPPPLWALQLEILTSRTWKAPPANMKAPPQSLDEHSTKVLPLTVTSGPWANAARGAAARGA